MQVERRCPVCNNRFAELLYVHTFELPELLNFMPNELSIVACEHCGMVYTSSVANQDTYNRYYDTLHQYTENRNTQDDSEDVYTTEGRLIQFHAIEKFINTDCNIIDIGTGTGGMLQIFRKHGYHHLLGIDIDDKRESFKKRGLGFQQGDINVLSQLPLPVGQKLYMLVGVLEHIYDISSAMCSLIKSMDEEDLLYVMVPDADSYIDYYDKPFRYFGMEHINHFNKNTLEQLFENYGFEIITYGRFENRFNESNKDLFQYILVKKRDFIKDNIGREKVASYVLKSQAEEALINEKINDLAENQQEIIIWGCGSYFFSLCEKTRLLECNIKYLVDNNKTLHNTMMKGIEIKSPKEIYHNPESKVCVAVSLYEENVLNEIVKMKFSNEVVTI